MPRLSRDAAGVEVRKEMKAAREHAGPRLARRVSGEWRAPATSQRPIRTANDAGTTRALLAPMLSPALPLILSPVQSAASPSCSLDRADLILAPFLFFSPSYLSASF